MSWTEVWAKPRSAKSVLAAESSRACTGRPSGAAVRLVARTRVVAAGRDAFSAGRGRVLTRIPSPSRIIGTPWRAYLLVGMVAEQRRRRGTRPRGKDGSHGGRAPGSRCRTAPHPYGAYLSRSAGRPADRAGRRR